MNTLRRISVVCSTALVCTSLSLMAAGAGRGPRSAAGRTTAAPRTPSLMQPLPAPIDLKFDFSAGPAKPGYTRVAPDGRLRRRSRLRLRARRAGLHRRQRQYHHQRKAVSVLRQGARGQLQRDGDLWRLQRRDHHDPQGGVGPADAGARRGSRRQGGRAHLHHQCPHAASAQAAHQRHRARRGDAGPVRPQQFARLGRQADR